MAGAQAALQERGAAIDRYLRAFEAGRLPESACADRLAALGQEVQALAARTADLEAECETTPAIAAGDALMDIRRRVERAVADGAPEQLKRLLDTVVEQILVESRACIQPYFVAPTVRTRIGQHLTALKRAHEAGDLNDKRKSLNNLGSCYFRLGEANRAAIYYQEALALAKQTRQRKGEGRARSGIGLCLAR